MINKHKIWLAIFVAPAILMFLLFYAVPLAMVFGTSFTNWKISMPVKFIGFGNFMEFANDPAFMPSFVNTMKWLLLMCTVFVGLGIMVAILTIKEKRFMVFARKAYLIPNMIAVAVMARVFYAMFNSGYGLVNQFIQAIGFKDFNKNWYYEADSSFLVVALSTVLFAGVVTLMISAEIASIPIDTFESAKIDGANEFQTSIFIVLPMLKNIIATSLILASTWALKSFEVVYLTTEGGPGYDTMNLPLLLYKKAMSEYSYGYANAIGVVIFMLGIFSIAAISKVSKIGETHY